MTFRITCGWDSAPEVRTPELSATWAHLRIDVNDVAATLVKDHHAPHSLRESIDVSVYPLAEWLALNWWTLSTSSHGKNYSGTSLAGAGDGFPWPALELRSDRGQLWMSQSRADAPAARVTPISVIDAVLEHDEVLAEMGRFIDATVRRLDDAGITGTLLQDEWSAIQGADEEEHTFAIVAAAWGLDPYDISDDDAEALLSANAVLDDPILLADLARAVSLEDLSSAKEWIARASRVPLSEESDTSLIEELQLSVSSFGGRPWRLGYERAQQFRGALGLSSTDLAPIGELVSVAVADANPPVNVEALVRREGQHLGAVLGPQESVPRIRFLSARTVARRMTDPQGTNSLLTTGSRYTDRMERAFAAEFLAPAAGVDELLNGDFSEASQERVAKQLQVSSRVIEHQIENQIAA